VISPTQRPVPDNTQHSQETEIHVPSGIRTRNPSKRTAVHPRLRPRGHALDVYWVSPEFKPEAGEPAALNKFLYYFPCYIQENSKDMSRLLTSKNLSVSNFNVVIIRVSMKVVAKNMSMTPKRRTGRRSGPLRHAVRYAVSRMLNIRLARLLYVS
jgi:hypothetical protein